MADGGRHKYVFDDDGDDDDATVANRNILSIISVDFEMKYIFFEYLIYFDGYIN